MILHRLENRLFSLMNRGVSTAPPAYAPDRQTFNPNIVNEFLSGALFGIHGGTSCIHVE